MESAIAAARPRITPRVATRVRVDASHGGRPRRRSIPVNGCTAMTRTSARRTGATISANCRTARTATRSAGPGDQRGRGHAAAVDSLQRCRRARSRPDLPRRGAGNRSPATPTGRPGPQARVVCQLRLVAVLPGRPGPRRAPLRGPSGRPVTFQRRRAQPPRRSLLRHPRRRPCRCRCRRARTMVPTTPVARPQPNPTAAPWRVGCSCFLTIRTFPSSSLAITAASKSCEVRSLAAQLFDRLVVGDGGVDVVVRRGDHVQARPAPAWPWGTSWQPRPVAGPLDTCGLFGEWSAASSCPRPRSTASPGGSPPPSTRTSAGYRFHAVHEVQLLVERCRGRRRQRAVVELQRSQPTGLDVSGVGTMPPRPSGHRPPQRSSRTPPRREPIRDHHSSAIGGSRHTDCVRSLRPFRATSLGRRSSAGARISRVLRDPNQPPGVS